MDDLRGYPNCRDSEPGPSGDVQGSAGSRYARVRRARHGQAALLSLRTGSACHHATNVTASTPSDGPPAVSSAVIPTVTDDGRSRQMQPGPSQTSRSEENHCNVLGATAERSEASPAQEKHTVVAFQAIRHCVVYYVSVNSCYYGGRGSRSGRVDKERWCA